LRYFFIFFLFMRFTKQKKKIKVKLKKKSIITIKKINYKKSIYLKKIIKT
jgi:hypothetical protein